MKPNNTNKWLQLIGIPIQMGITIYLFACLGQYLDQNYQSENYTKFVTLFGVFIALYLVIQQVNRINK